MFNDSSQVKPRKVGSVPENKYHKPTISENQSNNSLLDHPKLKETNGQQQHLEGIMSKLKSKSQSNPNKQLKSILNSINKQERELQFEIFKLHN